MRVVVMWHIGLPYQVLVVAMCFFPQPAGLWDPHGVYISRIPHLFCLFSSISLHLFEFRIPSSINSLILIPIWFLVFDAIHCLQVLDIMSCHTYHDLSVSYTYRFMLLLLVCH